MPNGGQISCPYCTYSREHQEKSMFGICDIWGIECSPFIICRSFREPRQSHRAARKHWSLLERIEPGIVYYIDNGGGPLTGTTKPMYKVCKISEE